MTTTTATTTTAITTIFFDIGGVLADTHAETTGNITLKVLPGVLEALDKCGKLQLGIISNTGDLPTDRVKQALEAASLARYFKPNLVILSGEVGMDKCNPAIFQLAAARAEAAPAACLYVGDDPDERRNARLARLHSSKSLAAALNMLHAPAPAAPKADLFGDLTRCIDDAITAANSPDTGPEEPGKYTELIGRLEAAQMHLPPAYRELVADPYLKELRRIGLTGFQQVLKQDPQRVSGAGLLFDIAQAILQNGEEYQSIATDAFQEIVSDLYDGFLSAGVRAGLKMPDKTVLAPLVKWGNPSSGPYTWPIDATSSFNIASAIVNLPPANAIGGLFAWTALPHEAAGHDFLHANEGLQQEMTEAVFNALQDAKVGSGLADYWSRRIDETASDVMGILNTGPAAGLGLIVYFRALNSAWGSGPHLRNEGDARDPHPADILRGFLAAATTRLLSFKGATDWGAAIERATMADLTSIVLNGVPVSLDRAKQSCNIVASTLAATRMRTLNNHSMLEIQNWRDQDEEVAQGLCADLLKNDTIPPVLQQGVYAAHVVAGAALAALDKTADIPTVFTRMQAALKQMHDMNSAWGPLFIAHPGDVRRDRYYVPSPKTILL